MILCFELTMPSRGSWDNKWGGDSNYYARTRTLSANDAKIILAGKERNRYYYNFGDGWCACVIVKEVGGSESKAISGRSIGFDGYDWMIDSIIENCEIRIRK